MSDYGTRTAAEEADLERRVPHTKSGIALARRLIELGLHALDSKAPTTYIAEAEAEAVTTFLQSDRAESLLERALYDCWHKTPRQRGGVDYIAELPSEFLARRILASLLEEMKR